MISRLIVLALMLCVMLSSSAQAQQDPNDLGLPDTVAFAYTVNTDTTKFTLELYGFNDSAVIGTSMGLHWNNQNFQMDRLLHSNYSNLLVQWRAGNFCVLTILIIDTEIK